MSLSHSLFKPSESLAKPLDAKTVNFTSLSKLVVSDEKANGITSYVLCNEQNQDETLATLRTNPLYQFSPAKTDAPTVHIGFSFWFNLDLLSLSTSQYAIILDIDINMITIYNIFKKILCDVTVTNRETFVKKFTTAIDTDPRGLNYFPVDHFVELLQENSKRPFGFLSSENNFLRIKQLCCDGKIFFGKADICDPTQIENVVTWCKTNKMKVDSLYISNIPEWISHRSKVKWNALLENIKRLADTSTRIIDANYPIGARKIGSGPPQRLFSLTQLNAMYSPTKKPKFGLAIRALALSDSDEDTPNNTQPLKF